MKLWVDHTAWVSKRARRVAASLERGAVESIAVIKYGALGDLVLARPFLITLRDYFPHARLTLSIASHYQNGAPADLVDHVHICFGKAERNKPLGETWTNLRQLGAHDLLFDLTCNARSLWVTRFNRARLKVGFIPGGGHRWTFWMFYDLAVPRAEYKFEAETYLDQLSALGLDHDWPLRFDLPPPPARRSAARTILYFPGASDPYKCWPAERFTALIERLLESEGDCDHLVLGGVAAWERELAHQVAAPFAARDAVRVVEPGEHSFEVVRSADLLISNDNGIRNYAIAAGVPTIGVFFATLPFRYRPRFGLHRAVFALDGSPPSVDEVAGSAAEILAALKASPEASG